MSQQLPDNLVRALLMDWFEHFAIASGLAITQRGTVGGKYTFGTISGTGVTATPTDAPTWLSFAAEDVANRTAVGEAASKARSKVDAGDFGSEIWYSVPLREPVFNFFASRSAFIFRLGTQMRIKGWRRLGSSILLDFDETTSEEGVKKADALFAPQALVTAHIAVPCPFPGQFSGLIINGIVETVAAITTFALGRPVDIPPAIIPKEIGKQKEAIALRRDPSVLTLARKRVSLDVFSPLAVDGGIEWSFRARAALL